MFYKYGCAIFSTKSYLFCIKFIIYIMQFYRKYKRAVDILHFLYYIII